MDSTILAFATDTAVDANKTMSAWSSHEWFEKAAVQGKVAAQCSLGLAYDLGRGVPRSDDKAFELCSQSAANGNSSAQYNLAVSGSRST